MTIPDDLQKSLRIRISWLGSILEASYEVINHKSEVGDPCRTPIGAVTIAVLIIIRVHRLKPYCKAIVEHHVIYFSKRVHQRYPTMVIAEILVDLFEENLEFGKERPMFLGLSARSDDKRNIGSQRQCFKGK
ncbi:hypothetical protein CAPTEDRAFT_189830 [Capitella teleta]|uniref:Uncharacterized protein n=1 Tax=Capitella teleta TaxID=283909 RepID=R7U8N3_CAPTE|nr:hypothetical protein CAPTEDRAFT_189830 [Capitella teleta]|eukprot:ELU02339.1 hypothetical protein CAPTEDRAFT_189830 [Capitella teleta]